MSLRKKIIISFFISAFIISMLTVFEYVSFIQARNEMRFLEVTGTIRNISLELRRHEKNFFLFPEMAAVETAAAHDYLAQLDEVTGNIQSGDPHKIQAMRELVTRYRIKFATIESSLAEISREFQNRKESLAPNQNFVPLAEAYSRDKPGYVADFLQNTFALPADDPQIVRLQQLDSDINTLRETGEDIITTSEELDKNARDEADRGIRQSQIAIVVFFPLFLLGGLGALIYISTGLVRRLKTLTVAIEKIGSRFAPGAPGPREEGNRKDEVDVLIDKFNQMNSQLTEWEEELHEKNQELVQSKKLAAIGTMASGVAHELNNPLNNINLSAQVLKRRINTENTEAVSEIVEDIAGQTARLKGIVGNLLEFAREREPQLKEIDLKGLVASAYGQAGKTADVSGIVFLLEAPEGVTLSADPDQLERVFVNLFSNAIAAMAGQGRLAVHIKPEDQRVKILVSDTGGGMPAEDKEKIFDPFYTKNEKGTGLGLAIVMNIIKKHCGNISVISEEDMGTIFEITMPQGGR